jgi:tetratricopeptide (TPR) repeat protein
MIAHEEGGMDARRARYDELREAYFGRAIFDFGEGSLTGLSGRLARAGNVEDAVTVLEMNLGFFPESQSIWWQLAQTLEADGDLEAALSALRSGLAVDPESGFAQFFQEKISALGGP